MHFAIAPIDADERYVHAAEAEAVASAVDARRREFATGRRLAHGLLAELGRDAGPLLLGRDRAPTWPAGVVGSIAHGAGTCAVAVARDGDVEGLGIDVEDDGPLSDDLFAAILTPGERDAFEDEHGALGELAKRAFCAKEAAYKALVGRQSKVLDFHDVTIELAGDRFAAHHDGIVLEGRFAERPGSILAAVCVPRSRVANG